MALSRLDSDFFTKNLHYAASYWDEHRDNYKEMLDKLMVEETLERMANHASALTMTFNHKIGWIDFDYNINQIHGAYSNLIDEIKMRKLYLFEFMDAYFAAFIDQFEELAKVAKAQSQDPNLLTSGRNKTDPKNSPELLNIKKVFNNPRFDDKGLDPFAKKLIGDKYDKKMAKENFYPQLLLFFMRFLDIYDQSLEGAIVKEYMEKNYQEDNPQLKGKTAKEEMIKKLGGEVMKSFSKKEFWDTRYSTAPVATYDWYIQWAQMKKLVLAHVDPLKTSSNRTSTTSVLVEGCGNSSLSEELYDLGITKISSIDFCDKIVENMKYRANKSGRSTLHYEQMDVRGLRYNDGVFDVVVDKGCLDCMVCTETESESKKFLDLTLSEANRVLRNGGYYVLVSCGINQERFEALAVKRFGWKVIVAEVIDTEGKNFNAHLIIAQKRL